MNNNWRNLVLALYALGTLIAIGGLFYKTIQLSHRIEYQDEHLCALNQFAHLNILTKNIITQKDFITVLDSADYRYSAVIPADGYWSGIPEDAQMIHITDDICSSRRRLHCGYNAFFIEGRFISLREAYPCH